MFCLLLRVSVNAHEEDRVGGTFIDEVHEREVGDEAARLSGPRRTEAEDSGSSSRDGTCKQCFIKR